MNRYHILDCAVVDAPPQVLFDTLTDFEHAHEWFPAHYKVEMTENRPVTIGRELMLGVNPAVTVGWRIDAADNGKSFRIGYTKGWHRGHGVWRFEESGCGTKVSFEIDIVAKNKLYSWLYSLVNLPKRHSHDIHLIISLLAKRVGANPPKDCSSKVRE